MQKKECGQHGVCTFEKGIPLIGGGVLILPKVPKLALQESNQKKEKGRIFTKMANCVVNFGLCGMRVQPVRWSDTKGSAIGWGDPRQRRVARVKSPPPPRLPQLDLNFTTKRSLVKKK